MVHQQQMAKDLESKLEETRLCCQEVRKLANCVVKFPMKKSVITEFYYQIKVLEQEFHQFAANLKETHKKNANLSKELEFEKEKSRKRSIKMQELETLLATAEFKLRVQTNKTKIPSAKSSKISMRNATIQCGGFIADDAKESVNVVDVIENMTNTTCQTLERIRSMVDSQRPVSRGKYPDLGDYRDSVTVAGDMYEEIPVPAMHTKEELLEVINELKQNNVLLQDVIKAKDCLLLGKERKRKKKLTKRRCVVDAYSTTDSMVTSKSLSEFAKLQPNESLNLRLEHKPATAELSSLHSILPKEFRMCRAKCEQLRLTISQKNSQIQQKVDDFLEHRA